MVALDALLHCSAEDAAQAASTVLSPGSNPGEGLQAAAFQVLLLSLPNDEAVKKAVEQISVDNRTLRKLALAYLAVGPMGVQVVLGELYLDAPNIYQAMAFGSSQPIAVTVPAGLKTEVLLPALKDPDADTQGYAGYLLCLANHREGLAPLLAKWRQQPSQDPWRRLVYRAVASFGDDAQTPLLAEVYHTFTPNDWNVREFYWTIRSMDGPEILKLRKQIRDDVGMERLR
jgi:hypothetical protein